MSEQVFYIEIPRWLISHLLLSLILIIYGGAIAFVFGLHLVHVSFPESTVHVEERIWNSFVYIGVGCVGIGLVRLLRDAIKLAIAWRKPMLVLTDAAVTFWGATIPWKFVTSCVPVKVRSGVTWPALAVSKGVK